MGGRSYVSVVLKAFTVGLGTMYLFDPAMGKRRRRTIRDGAGKLFRDFNDEVRRGVRDAEHRLQGVAAETRGRLRRESPSSPQLEERVRALLGRVSSHPSALDVQAEGGRVILSGPVLAPEEDRILSAVQKVRGVREVENRLRPHPIGTTVPELQGDGSRIRGAAVGENWPPATRLLAGLVGGGLLANGLRKASPAALLTGFLGTGLLARAVANRPVPHLFGTGSSYEGVTLHKSITIDAPLEEVYRLWTNYANFPRFMRNVRRVEDLGNGRSAWTVAGPLGTPIRFTAVVTQQQVNELFAWRSEADASVAHAGTVRFQPTAEGATRVDIRITYAPPAGVTGHAIASLFGVDPKTDMDEDLVRMKSFLETGLRPDDAAAA